MNMQKTLLGVQNPVMGFSDPFQMEHYMEYTRGGENVLEDRAPSVEEYMALCREFRLDFVMHQVIPHPDALKNMLRLFEENGLRYILGNEFYNFNKAFTPGTSRGDLDPAVLKGAGPGLLGLLYDETEHMQLHSRYYAPENPYCHWADPNLPTMEASENALMGAIRDRVERYGGIPVYTEHVFPIMNHIFARAGCIPCPKMMKEEFNSLAMAVSMGAAKQYGRPFGVCCDLWGPDIGHWFLRFWGMPGHPVREFANTLTAAWLLRPQMLFVENIDALAVFQEKGYALTGFGRAFQEFAAKKEEINLPYSFEELSCEIAVVRSDDCIMSDKGTFDGKGCFGAESFPPDEKNLSFSRVMYQLTHKTTAGDALTMHNSSRYTMPSNQYYPWEKEDVRQFPLANGISGAPVEHKFLYPLNSTLVFDENVRPDLLENCRLAILCGSRIKRSTVDAVLNALRHGTCVIVAAWFRSWFTGAEGIHFVRDFSSAEFVALVRPYIGSPEEWSVSFGAHELIMRDEGGLQYEIREQKEALSHAT